MSKLFANKDPSSDDVRKNNYFSIHQQPFLSLSHTVLLYIGPKLSSI